MKKFIFTVAALMAMVAGIAGFKSLQYDVETLAGDRFAWQDLKGQWVVINYFAEWCAPCLEEIPELNQFAVYAANNDDLSFYAVNYDTADKDVLAALQTKYDINFDLIAAPIAELPLEKPKGLPATYVIAPDGETVHALYGTQTERALIKAIAQLKGL